MRDKYVPTLWVEKLTRLLFLWGQCGWCRILDIRNIRGSKARTWCSCAAAVASVPRIPSWDSKEGLFSGARVLTRLRLPQIFARFGWMRENQIKE